jgi:hypothetical protein
MARTKQKPQKRTPSSVNLKKSRGICLGNIIEAERIISLLSSEKLTLNEALRRLGNISILLMNTHSRIMNPLIPIERFLNQLKIQLLIAQTKFLDIRNHVQQINSMTFNTSTFDEISHSLFELLQHCSMIECLITQIESSFGMIRMILEQIPEESRQRLVASIQAFRATFDQFVNDFSPKNEEILKFLNSGKEHIESMIHCSNASLSLKSKIQQLTNELSTASSNRICMGSVLSGSQNELTRNEKNISQLTDSMKHLVEEYVRTQHERQIECPFPNIDSILREMSWISSRFELYHQSDESPIRKTYEQNLFDSRMKRGLAMVNAMVLNQNIQGLRKVCAYLTVLLNHCYERLP